MDEQGTLRWGALGGEDLGGGSRIEGVSAQAIDGLGGHRHQFAGAQQGDGPGDEGGVDGGWIPAFAGMTKVLTHRGCRWRRGLPSPFPAPWASLRRPP